MPLPARRLLGASLQSVLDALGPLLGLALVVAIFSWLTGDPQKYLGVVNLKTIIVQLAIVATCGVGMTLVIISAGIDLSVGSIVALSSVVVGLTFKGEFFRSLVTAAFQGRVGLAWGVAVAMTLAAVVTARSWSARRARIAVAAALWVAGWLAFGGVGGYAAVAAGAVVGLVCGLVNGLLVTRTGVVPFIITLGSMQIFRGVAQLIAKGESVYVDPNVLRDQYGWLEDFMSPHPAHAWMVFSPGVWLMGLVALAAHILLHRTRLGRYMFAIGSNEEAARLSGINVPLIKLVVYAIGGLMAGLGGIMQFSRMTSGDATAADGMELDVIAAVVIGGGSLRGGAGSIVGTLVGAAIMQFMRSGCTLAGISPWVQRILIGAIIVLAVAIDEWRRRRRA